jgi:tetratricopeptide (TPR) repeat protein
MIVGGWLPVLLMATASPAAETREEAVAAAREGRPEEGIAALHKLLADGPDDPLAAYDLAVILTWVNRPREATDAFERAGAVEVPAYALAPIVRAYRDQKRFAEAERWAREGQRRFPIDSTWPKLLGLVLADQKRTNLLELGAPFAAGALLPETPLGIQVRQAGALVRWGGHVVPRDPRRRFEGTDAALKRLEALLRKARSARKPDAGLIARLRRDRVVALRQRERWADAVAQTQELRADGDQIPPYVREAEADSLLALRRPREARLGYEDVLSVDPEHREAHIGRFFALVEEENFRAAFAEIDALAASEPPGLRLPEQRVTRPNSNWLEGHVLAAEARSFADMPGAAWQRLLPLAEGASGQC